MKNEFEKYSDNDLWISNKNALYYYYCCSNLLSLICETEITILIIWYFYSNKCEKWYMKSNTKSIIEFALEINDVIADLFHYNLLPRFGEFYDLLFNGLWLKNLLTFIWISFIWISTISFYLIV